MVNLIAYTLDSVLELLVGDYFRYSIGVVAILGLIGLVYRLAGKAK